MYSINFSSINYGEIACFLSHYNIWKDVKAY